ncbi:MAG TPA: DUF2892 domain-containing protein [Thermomicrobiales bacterium]|nr:DUF2892 domain-containing protein [Thermomicrobiales bacterium]
MALIDFLATTPGRLLRIVLGAVIVLVGLLAFDGALAWIITIVGLVPFMAGAFDVCLAAPLFGLPLRGGDIRNRKRPTVR